MNRSLTFSAWVIAALTLASDFRTVQAGCPLLCCRHSCCCPDKCNHAGGSQNRGGGETQTRAPVAAPLVMSMPYYAAPMMMTGMPMMPTFGAFPAQFPQNQGRGATDTTAARDSGSNDCCERLDDLEKEMVKLARSVQQLQEIADGQTRALTAINQKLIDLNKSGAAGAGSQ